MASGNNSSMYVIISVFFSLLCLSLKSFVSLLISIHLHNFIFYQSSVHLFLWLCCHILHVICIRVPLDFSLHIISCLDFLTVPLLESFSASIPFGESLLLEDLKIFFTTLECLEKFHVVALEFKGSKLKVILLSQVFAEGIGNLKQGHCQTWKSEEAAVFLVWYYRRQNPH